MWRCPLVVGTGVIRQRRLRLAAGFGVEATSSASFDLNFEVACQCLTSSGHVRFRTVFGGKSSQSCRRASVGKQDKVLCWTPRRLGWSRMEAAGRAGWRSGMAGGFEHCQMRFTGAQTPMRHAEGRRRRCRLVSADPTWGSADTISGPADPMGGHGLLRRPGGRPADPTGVSADPTG